MTHNLIDADDWIEGFDVPDDVEKIEIKATYSRAEKTACLTNAITGSVKRQGELESVTECFEVSRKAGYQFGYPKKFNEIGKNYWFKPLKVIAWRPLKKFKKAKEKKL